MTDTPETDKQPSPEVQEKILDDNARKFTLDTLDPAILEGNHASRFLMTTDWLEMGEIDETKLAHKKFDDGQVEILLITKKRDKEGKRSTTRPPVTYEQYKALLPQSLRTIKKMRYEFKYLQDGILFDIKYDEFVDSPLRILEVDADTDDQRRKFEPRLFPVRLSEVTGDLSYYGFRVVEVM